MDIRKDSGYKVNELDKILNKHDVTFTLDIQHAYEHDSSMKYAWELVEMAGDHLQELHVSGETENNIHSLIHNADNKETISKFIKEFYNTGRDTPMIIEGEYNSINDINKEYNLLNNIV